MGEIIAFFGWRGWDDSRFIITTVNFYLAHLERIEQIRVGDCPTGADRIIRDYLTEQQVGFQEYVAQWNLYGKTAGPIRNHEMIVGRPPFGFGHYTASGAEYQPDMSPNPTGHTADLLVAFPEPNSGKNRRSGTWQAIGCAFDNGVEVRLPTHP